MAALSVEWRVFIDKSNRHVLEGRPQTNFDLFAPWWVQLFSVT